jgi:serine/threonine protein kinase/tetratricopeptide (TPR) repeat protein
MASAPATKRFELGRCLGEGGMGIVYEALDRESGTRVALKTLRHMTADSLTRLKREFRAMQDVEHPNLVSLGELASEDDRWFFTMELVEGTDVLEHVRPAPFPPEEPPPPSDSTERVIAFTPDVPPTPKPGVTPFDEARLRAVLPQLVDALRALHAAGLVHRDIKPSNVRVDRDGRVVLLDFGLVIDVGADTASMIQMAGTPSYMAPEQAASGRVGPEADWYALGALLFEMLTGVVPFVGPPLSVMMRKQMEEPPLPSSLAEGVPPDLEALCLDLMRFDPTARPTGSAVLRALGVPSSLRRASASYSISSQTQTTPFVGRVTELDVLLTAFRDMARGETVTVVVDGESGVGKSALVRRFAEHVAIEHPDLVVLAGRCYERESVPYKAFDEVVDALARYLGRLGAAEAKPLVPTKPMPLVKVFPVLRRVEAIAELSRGPQPALDPFELRGRAFSALRELLTRLGDRHPLVVVIDDVQWADADSRVLLAEVMRSAEAPKLLLVLTMRTAGPAVADAPHAEAVEQGRELIGALQGDVRAIALGRLPHEDARALAVKLLERVGVHDAEVAEQSARQAGGHPLFIDMMTRQSADLSSEVRNNLQLDDALWGVIGQLEATPRAILEVIATAGAPIAQEIAARAAGLEGDVFAKAVSLLRIAHLAQTSGSTGAGRIEPYHDRVRTAVLSHFDPARRAECHRRIAVALEVSGQANPQSLVVHWRGAGDVEQMSRYAVLAGDRATEALAFDRAARFYEIALSTHLSPTEERRALLVKLGEARANAGRGKRAAEAFRAAVEGASAAQALDLRRRAAEQLLRSGHFDEGLSAALAVGREVGMRLPATPWMAVLLFLLLRLWMRFRGLGFRVRDASQIAADELTRADVWWSLSFSLAISDTLKGANANAQHVLLALRIGEPRRIARSLAQEAAYVSAAGGPTWARSRILVGKGRSIIEKDADPYTVGWVEANDGLSHYLHGRYASGLELFERAEDLFATRCVGVAWELDTMRLFAVNSLAQLGRVAEMASRAERHLREASDRGDLYAAVNLRIGFANLRWLMVDDPAAARHEVAEAMAQWSKQGVHVEHFYELLALTNADLYEGRGSDALARFDEKWPALRRSLLPWRIQTVRTICRWMHGRSALAAAEVHPVRDELLRSAERDALDIHRERMPWSAPLGSLLLAGVSSLRGDDGLAVSRAREAVRGFDAADMALHAAVSRRTLGKLLGGDEGAGLARQAEAWMASQAVKTSDRLTAMLAPGGRP